MNEDEDLVPEEQVIVNKTIFPKLQVDEVTNIEEDQVHNIVYAEQQVDEVALSDPTPITPQDSPMQ